MSVLPPSPFLFTSDNLPDVKSPAACSRPLVSESAGAPNSVSPDATFASLPSGESDPSVRLDLASGESNSQLDGSIDLAGLDRSTTGTGSRSTPGEKDCASNFDAEMSALEAEVSALEAQWARDGILMNAATFCVSVSKDSNSKSSVTGA